MSREKLYNDIIKHLSNGGAVLISNHLKAYIIKPNCKDRLRFKGNSLYLARGKAWDCIDYCKFSFSK